MTVAGAVVNSNAFLWRPGRTAGEYLRLAGADEAAEPENMFILRADGSVYSSQYGDVARATMFPGDTIVVPPQLDRRAIMRNLLDISSVVGQFGLGAAAINVLK